MSVCGVRRFGAGAVVVGGAIATAAMFGVGAAQADPGDDVGAAASNSTDLLSTAITNFTDAANVVSGIDAGQTVFSSETAVSFLEDQLEPSESAILAHTGS
ncbi:MAG: hypothetical protein ACRDTN_15440, partial [Mycobacterium sp.]